MCQCDALSSSQFHLKEFQWISGFWVWRHQRNGAAQPVYTHWTQRNAPWQCPVLFLFTKVVESFLPQIYTLKAPWSTSFKIVMRTGKKSGGMLIQFSRFGWFIKLKTINMCSSQTRRLWSQAWSNVLHKTNCPMRPECSCLFRTAAQNICRELLFHPEKDLFG